MAKIEELRKQWLMQQQEELVQLRNQCASSKSTFFFWLITVGLSIWWVCSSDTYTIVEPTQIFGITLGDTYERISYSYLFAWFVLIITVLFSIKHGRNWNRRRTALCEAESVTSQEYIKKQEEVLHITHIMCPKCLNWFEKDIDTIRRYTIGSLENAGKWATATTIKQGAKVVGESLGECIGIGTQAGFAAGKAADAFNDYIGLKDYTGWHHRCPCCKYKWE